MDLVLNKDVTVEITSPDIVTFRIKQYHVCGYNIKTSKTTVGMLLAGLNKAINGQDNTQTEAQVNSVHFSMNRLDNTITIKINSGHVLILEQQEFEALLELLEKYTPERKTMTKKIKNETFRIEQQWENWELLHDTYQGLSRERVLGILMVLYDEDLCSVEIDFSSVRVISEQTGKAWEESEYGKIYG